MIAEKYEDRGVPLLGKSLKERAIINQYWFEAEIQNLVTAINPIIKQLWIRELTSNPVDEEIVGSCAVKAEASV